MGADVFMKPMILHCVMLGPRCHWTRLEVAEGKCASIIFMYFDVKINFAS